MFKRNLIFLTYLCWCYEFQQLPFICKFLLRITPFVWLRWRAHRGTANACSSGTPSPISRLVFPGDRLFIELILLIDHSYLHLFRVRIYHVGFNVEPLGENAVWVMFGLILSKLVKSNWVHPIYVNIRQLAMNVY